MCGLCGELRLDGRSADLGVIHMMKGRLEKRGPDHDGCYSDGPLGFGHRRLAIIDLTEHA
ncbi:MAG: N-acetylglutaminylglutamine amidotransferase, partial [Candidatus Sedimenticola sp. (ex Thyasira tokunagai)]